MAPLKAFWQAIIRTLAFISKELRIVLHQPRLIFSLILGPFLILLLFGIGYSETPQQLRTLFVIPEGSPIEPIVTSYTQQLDDRFIYEGTTHDADAADRQLRAGEVDVVIVTPFNPMADWQQGQQSVFTLYHAEIDPLEETYIQVLMQRLVEEINRQVLSIAMEQGQSEAVSWEDNVRQARDLASTVRTAMAAGDQLAAQESAESLQQQVDLLTLAVGSTVSLMAGIEQTAGDTQNAQGLREALERLQSQTNQVTLDSADLAMLRQGEESAAEVEESLAEVDTMLTSFKEIDTAVLVAPFHSETINVGQVPIAPMHFYVPAVIALLLQHLAITLAGLSIIREKRIGAMELFKAAPVSALEILLGKYSGYIILTSMLAAVLTALLAFVLRVPQLGSWLNYILIILALLLASLGIGFNISLSAQSDSQAIQYSMLTLLAAIFFSGLFLPLYRLAPFVRIVSWTLPATYSTVLLKDQMLRGHAPQLILLGALIGLGLALFVLAWVRLNRSMKID